MGSGSGKLEGKVGQFDGGGALEFQWLPTAKKPCGAEAVNFIINLLGVAGFLFFLLFFCCSVFGGEGGRGGHL